MYEDWGLIKDFIKFRAILFIFKMAKKLLGSLGLLYFLLIFMLYLIECYYFFLHVEKIK